MAMSKRSGGEKQEDIWIAHTELAVAPGHPFYKRLNELLEGAGFDEMVEGLCARFYHARLGRPSLRPGICFRALLIGYFEGIDSERGIAWRVADSLALRRFLGIGLDEQTPYHSTISRTRRLIDIDRHREVFSWVLGLLAERGLLKGQRMGIDATTLEANAAMRSIVRRDSGETYDEFLCGLAKASGIDTPTREDLVRLDRKRKKRTSNKEGKSPADGDARIAKMKDGRTNLAHKPGRAADRDTGAVLERMKGYEVRTYIPEKKQKGRRHWQGKGEQQKLVYQNRERVGSEYGKSLLRRRSELVERSFAHCYETGGMRRCHLRGQQNILKRQLIHLGAFNLSLILRKLLGAGTPREWNNQGDTPFLFVYLLLRRQETPNESPRSQPALSRTKYFAGSRCRIRRWRCRKSVTCTTGC